MNLFKNVSAMLNKAFSKLTEALSKLTTHAKSLTVGCSLAIIGLPAFTASAQLAQTPFNGSFLAGNYLVIPNTNVAGATIYTNVYNGTNIWIKGGIAITNQTAASPYFSPLASAFALTNTAAISDVGLYYNRDGSVPSASVNVLLHGLDARATNTIVLEFASVSRGVANTAAQNIWSFSVTANGTNMVGLNTNVPTAFLQGAHFLRLFRYSSGNGTNVFLDYLDLKGFKP